MNKKQERNERRRLAAIKRDRLKHFLTILILIMKSWEIGLHGGGKDGDITYDAIEATPSQKRYIFMQAGRINKARDILVRQLMPAETMKKNFKFFVTSNEIYTSIAVHIINALQEEQTHFQQCAVLTYIIYCALYDYAALENDTRPELKKLINLLGTLADYIIPEDSPLVDPMNAVYWATREELQKTTDFTCGGRIEWLPSELEKKRNAA